MSEGMNAQDPLAQLRDIHLPESTGWWPLAWGWWLVLALIVLGLGFALYRLRIKRRRQRYRQEALAELERAYRHFREYSDTAAYLQSLNQLLRRAALSALPPEQHSRVAGLSGEAWLEFLDGQLPEKHRPFTEGPGRALLAGPYQANPEADVEALQQLGREWLRDHRLQRPANHRRGKSGHSQPHSPRRPEATRNA